MDDVEQVLMAAVGGQTVSRTLEGRERYAINLRYARAFRDTPEALGHMLVPTPGGAQIPISQLAHLEFISGPPMLRNEDGFMVSFVLVDVKDIGIAEYVDLAKQVIREKVALPQGVRLEWAGQYQYFEQAKAELSLLVPLALAIVFLMLFLNHGSIGESLLIMLTIPFSLIGAVWLLYWLDYNLSVAVWVGMIALAGLAAEMGVLMTLYLDLSYRKRSTENRLQSRNDLTEAIVEGAARRIRPKLMTGITTLIGLTPILWQTGTGADVMKRIAAPMVGGIVSTLIVVLIVFPAIYAYWKEWEFK
nr:efflux RND transporter permease subunit [Methylomarinum sp. Ch1-1]MDP4521669.1 efflux RND transporter permease subunit [Methylomarinum sp. Ch1-1]